MTTSKVRDEPYSLVIKIFGRDKMTCVAVIGDKKSKQSWMAADSCNSMGLEYTGAETKIWEVKSKGDTWLFGVAGLAAHAQVMRYGIDIKDMTVPEDPTKITEFLFREWTPRYREAAEKSKVVLTKDGIEKTENVAIFALRGIIYRVDSYLSAFPMTDSFGAIGSGGQFAEGILWVQEDSHMVLNPHKRLKQALKGASKYCQGVGGRIDYLHA